MKKGYTMVIIDNFYAMELTIYILNTETNNTQKCKYQYTDYREKISLIENLLKMYQDKHQYIKDVHIKNNFTVMAHKLKKDLDELNYDIEIIVDEIEE